MLCFHHQTTFFGLTSFSDFDTFLDAGWDFFLQPQLFGEEPVLARNIPYWFNLTVFYCLHPFSGSAVYFKVSTVSCVYGVREMQTS